MSFYITLPSNSSLQDFPDNTLTNYKTRLKTPLRLNGNYEVALAQIMFPKNWKYKPDGKVKIVTPEFESTITINFLVYESLSEMLKNFSERCVTAGVEVEMKYDVKSARVFLMVPPESTLTFEDGINEIFGFKRNNFEGTEEKHIFFADEAINNDLNLIQSLYIYLDICQYQIVGDTEAPLLQVVATNNSQENYVEKIFDAPHYIPIARNNLETIEVDIRSDLGNPIHFHSGKVVVKLHFRKISYY